MSQENVEIVREAFEAFQGGDSERTAELLDPEVEFHAAWRQRSSSTPATTSLCSCTNTGAVEAAESSWKPRRQLSLR
jgi:ketosteroid isomerase-like protein